MKTRSWTDDELRTAVKNARSYRAVLIALGLVPAGGNYLHIKQRIFDLNLDTSHFTGKAWNIGLQFQPKVAMPLTDVLVVERPFQSFGLKKRLFRAGLKKSVCELCGWCEVSADGRVPVELDHINGDHNDNRLENLRILCPNCHSLQLTHRGKNKKVRYIRAGVVTGSQD